MLLGRILFAIVLAACVPLMVDVLSLKDYWLLLATG
jgi:hypothetical protein